MIYIKELVDGASDNAIGSSDLDYQAADKFLLLSSVCLSHLTNLVQSILTSDRGLGL